MTTKKILIIVLAFAFAFSMVFTGCTARKPATPNNTGNNVGMTQSDNLARAAQTVPGVTSARVVVLGTTAYVGINLDRNAKLGNTNRAGAGTGTTGTGTNMNGTGIGGFGTTGATGTGTTGTGFGTTTGSGTTVANNAGVGVGNTGGINQNGNATTGTGFGTTNGTLTGTGTTGTATNAGINNTGTGTTNNSGLIGIGNGRMGNTTDNINNIKTQVASAVRSADATITTVYVSTDPAFMNRVQSIYNDVRNGRAVTDFRSELNNLVRGLTPQRT